MLNVHLRFTDSLTKSLLPVRLRITGPTGGTFVPLGRLPIFPCGRAEELGGHVRLGGENFVTIDGGCEVPLPAGVPLRIRASHGPEYELLDHMVTLNPGQMALRFELTRWPISQVGWVSGDLRAHFLSPHAAALEGASEGLDFVQVLARSSSVLARDGNTYPVYSNICEFSGQAPALSAHGCEVFVNTLNTHPMLGSLALLNSHRIVHPLSFGGVDGPDDWSLCDWTDQCHRKNGLVVWVDAFRPEAGLLGGEALIARILGKIDAIEFDSQPRSQPFLPWYYRLLNAGFWTPLVGSSGKESNRTALGSMRTYAQLGSHGTGSWVEAVRAGRTFTSNGPLLKLEVVDRLATASVESQVPFEKLELVQNGRVVATAVADSGTRFTAELKCEVAPHGWLAARCIGGAGSSLYPGGPVFAHTSPIQLGAEPGEVSATAMGQLRDCVTSTKEWIESEGRFSTAKGQEHLLARCAEALAILGAGAP